MISLLRGEASEIKIKIKIMSMIMITITITKGSRPAALTKRPSPRSERGYCPTVFGSATASFQRRVGLFQVHLELGIAHLFLVI
jgi:hypothetical protein